MSALARADWERLRELRSRFLAAQERDAPAPTDDYFLSRRDVELYAASFGRRIEWKWAAALRELELRAPELAPVSVLDWGCGAGAASRALLGSPVGRNVARVVLLDRSRPALDFARESLLALRPGLAVEFATPAHATRAELCLASHVLDELDEIGEQRLEAAVRACDAAILLESGARASARRLGRLRARLLDAFAPLAPCTHAAQCGVLARERDWCHFFAAPPAETFQDAFWSEFSRELGIDLRSLAYSFVAFARAAPTPATELHRILGRPRLLKGRALVDACSASGVHTLSLLERVDKRLFKSLGAVSNEPRLWRVELERERVRAVDPSPHR